MLNRTENKIVGFIPWSTEHDSQLKLSFSYIAVYMIKLGTLEQENTADVEWRWHPYTHTAKKRKFLSVV